MWSRHVSYHLHTSSGMSSIPFQHLPACPIEVYQLNKSRIDRDCNPPITMEIGRENIICINVFFHSNLGMLFSLQTRRPRKPVNPGPRMYKRRWRRSNPRLLMQRTLWSLRGLRGKTRMFLNGYVSRLALVEMFGVCNSLSILGSVQISYNCW